jgi:hypothetical protein
MIYSIKSSNKYQKASVFIPCPLVIMKLRGLVPRLRSGWFEGMVSIVEPKPAVSRSEILKRLNSSSARL